MFKEVVLFALLGLAQATCTEDVNAWCGLAIKSKNHSKMVDMDERWTDEAQEVCADEQGEIGALCTLAETQQLAVLSGMTGPMAQEWPDTLADMTDLQTDLVALKIDPTWDLEPVVDDENIWGCHTTLKWWCDTIAVEGNEPTDEDVLEAAEICGDEAATNEYCAGLGIALTLIDAGNLITAVLSDEYIQLTSSELERLADST